MLGKLLPTLLWVISCSYFISQSVKTKVTNFYMGSATATISTSNNNFQEPEKSSAFDSDFAEAISKPLPQWYRDAKAEKEALLKEVEKNRERIVKEFKLKYEISEEQKRLEREKKWARIQQRAEETKRRKSNWLSKATNLFSNADKTDEEDISMAKQNWEKFWEEEEKQTGFYLPGIFEVFPELQFKWPNWARRKDGTAIDCESDEDCPIPQACCAHPIIPGQQFCCTGWGKRVMVPAYAVQRAYYAPEPSQPSSGGHGSEEYTMLSC
jgi:hypothetical protein